MLPECAIECIKASCAVRVAERVHLIEQIRMSADGALPEHDQITGQDVGALDGDADRYRAIQIAHVVLRTVDHGLAAMDIHRVIDGNAHPLRRLQLHDAGDDGGMVTVIERGTRQPPRSVEQIRGARDPRERLLDALELADRYTELLAHASISPAGARGVNGSRGR